MNMELSLKAIALVASGGAIGASLRYLTYVALQGTDFPWATLLVNLTGSFALAFLLFYVILDYHSDVVSFFVIMGVLGAFTTFSSFSMETLLLYMDKGLAAATLNVTLNVGLCIAGAALGRFLALKII